MIVEFFPNSARSQAILVNTWLICQVELAQKGLNGKLNLESCDKAIALIENLTLGK